MADVLAVRNEYRLQEWMQIHQRCRESGLSNREYCRQNGISAILVISGFCVYLRRKPELNHVLKICLALGAFSEFVKFFSAAKILPMVEPLIVSGPEGAALEYAATGRYAPYLEMAYLPLELCSLLLIPMAAALWAKDGRMRRCLIALLYVCGVTGGTLGIVMAYFTVDFSTLADFFTTARAWQFFLYHAMTVTLGLYAGLGPESSLSLRDLKSTITGLVCLDIPVFYLNSIFSQPVYAKGKPVGLVYAANFFSSYQNPIGLVLKNRWRCPA